MSATVGKYYRLSPEQVQKLESLAESLDMLEVDVVRLLIDSASIEDMREEVRMAKYHELVRDFADTIAEIKRLRAERDDYQAKAKEIEDSAPGPAALEGLSGEKMRAMERLWGQAGEADMRAQDLEARLDRDVSEAYAACPFPETREQGIRRFYEEAGL